MGLGLEGRRGKGVHGENFTPTGGIPARLLWVVELVESIGLWIGEGKMGGDELVIAVSGLAFSVGAADDDVCDEGGTGAEVYVRVCGGADEGAVFAIN